MRTAIDKVSGFGRTLVFIYGIFAVAATSRGIFQISTKFTEAPYAYALSLLSGIVYLIATFALAIPGKQWDRIAFITLCVEMIGVLVIGSASIIDVATFPHDTVWSKFGMGYGFIPLILPLVGLWWIKK